MRSRLLSLLWLVAALPGLYQLGLLGYTVARRFWFPYDLEWMEGGMLAHALRLDQGRSIYAPPSVDFVPYLYTPLYPALLAGLGKVFGLTYQLGRAVSVLSMLAVVACGVRAVAREVGPAPRAPVPRALGWAAGLTGLGFYAATYPYVEGWYDLVRGDTLFLALGTGGLLALRAWGPRPGSALDGWWHGRVAVAAALLALSFFAKQTGVMFVVAGGFALLVMNWRAVPTYVAVAGAIGGGGSLILDRLSGGWYWLYIFQVHQQHDFNNERFWKSFANQLWHFPALTLLLAVALIAVTVFAAIRRRLPIGGAGFFYWLWMFAAGTLIGSTGWATQWAHFNAYVPAFTFGSIAAGAAVVALAGCVGELASEVPRPVALVGQIIVCGCALLLLGGDLLEQRWQPKRWIPTAADRAAGDALIERIAGIEGEVYVPAHPWYAVLAGKRPFVHRMGVLDVGYRPPASAKKKPLPARARVVAGLEDSLRRRRFAAVIMDDRCQTWEFPGLTESYTGEPLARNQRPRVVTGARTVPATIWVPRP